MASDARNSAPIRSSILRQNAGQFRERAALYPTSIGKEENGGAALVRLGHFDGASATLIASVTYP